MLADKLRAASLSALPLPEFVSSSVNIVSTSNTNTVTAPAGIQDGDFLIAFGSADSSGRVISSYPAGFVETSAVQTPISIFVACKVAGAESGNYTFTWSGSSNSTIAILVCRNATRVNTVGSYVAGNAATFAAPSITPSYRGVLFAAYAFKSAATVSSAPIGMTQRVYHNSSVPSLVVYELSPQESAATGDKTITWSSSTSGSGILFQITNEPTVAPVFVASASTQNGSSATTLTINKPTGTVEGDLMVAVMATDGSITGWSGDLDWVELADQGSSTPSLRVAYKVAGPAEPSNYTFTASSGKILSGTILTYRYAAYDTIGSFTTGTNPLILPSISPSESQSILIAAGARGAASITLGTPTSMTARVTDADGTSPSYIVCDQTVAKGPTGTRSMSTGSTTNVAGILLSIKPTRSLS
jgi:hypothetical protein